jgi:hypothetical protein
MLTTEGIDAMAKSFASRTQNNGRMIFSTNKTKALKAMTYWVQDFFRISKKPTIANENEMTFKAQIRRAETRAKIRKTLRDSDIPSAANPGPLSKESKWKEWEEKFINFLCLHLGAKGIPLSYVICDKDEPDNETTFTDFISKTIACTPLEGEYYEADRLSVFNFIISFTTGNPSGNWVRNTICYQNRRKSMKALRDYFLGEGNITRSLADVERLKDSLHYKNERSMPFETFLTQCELMFNIFQQENEPMAEDANIRYLFKVIQHERLIQRTAGTPMSYTTCCNHLTTAVTELPEYQNRQRNIAGSTATPTGNTGSASIYNDNGTINATGHIKDWNSLPLSDKRLVYAKRKRKGVNFQSGNKKWTKNKPESSTQNTIQQLCNQTTKLKRQVKALKSSSSNTANENKNENDDNVANDAGDEFGGKSSKCSKK